MPFFRKKKITLILFFGLADLALQKTTHILGVKRSLIDKYIIVIKIVKPGK